jgi:uncharacterized protein
MQSPPLDDVVRFLSRPDTFPDAPTRVEVKETNTAYVFITDRFAYKMFKPVDAEPIRHTSLDQRRAACEAEVALNRRLADDIYMGIVAVTLCPDADLALNGGGPPVEWLIQMRRIEPEFGLPERLASGNLGKHELAGLAAHLAAFYLDLTPAPVQADRYVARMGEMLAEMEVLMTGIGDYPERKAFDRAKHKLQVLIGEVKDEMHRRVEKGLVVEGHGDLRPEHVYLLESGPVIIDCLAFEQELRMTDPADELSFLLLEINRLGYPEKGRDLQEAFFEVYPHRPSPRLLAFFRAFRACHRGSLAARRVEGDGDSDPKWERRIQSYLDEAALHLKAATEATP